ncbi:hypothetical protein L0Y46_03290, partial [bacterium]|nr:hypothetical protein [bacterium]
LDYCEFMLRVANGGSERLKISTIFFAFLAAFSPRTMNSRYVNSFFTSSNLSAYSGEWGQSR